MSDEAKLCEICKAPHTRCPTCGEDLHNIDLGARAHAILTDDENARLTAENERLKRAAATWDDERLRLKRDLAMGVVERRKLEGENERLKRELSEARAHAVEWMDRALRQRGKICEVLHFRPCSDCAPPVDPEVWRICPLTNHRCKGRSPESCAVECQDAKVPRCAGWCGKSDEHLPRNQANAWWVQPDWHNYDPVFCTEACMKAGRPLHPAQPGGPR